MAELQPIIVVVRREERRVGGERENPVAFYNLMSVVDRCVEFFIVLKGQLMSVIFLFL
jgi:hypothetical protein